MAIEWIQYPKPHKIIIPKPVFGIDASTTRNCPPERYLTLVEYNQEMDRIDTPAELRSFMAGPMGGKIDPVLGRMPDIDIEFISAFDGFLTEMGVDVHSCFKREEFGRIGISNKYATAIDRLLLETSHWMTVLPDSTNSHGTRNEVRYGTAIGKPFLFTFRKRGPELEFQKWVRELVEDTCSSSGIVFVTFDSITDLSKQVRRVLPILVPGKFSQELAVAA